jgi:hypothetical protein
VQAAHLESARVLDATAAEADHQRSECDAYVDTKLAEFEDLLTHTLRTVGKGRIHLRAPVNGVSPLAHTGAPAAGPAPYDYSAQ